MYIADLHIHSKYSRATARDMDLDALSRWAKIKGIALLGTGDCTHPQWRAELAAKLQPAGRGVYDYQGTRFILTAEVSLIYRKAEKTRRVHMIILAPDLARAEEIASALAPHGKLASDGRPILRLPCDELVRLLAGIDKDILLIPAHAWTPHYSIFGAHGGFDSPEECFEETLPLIPAIETGLSSDPSMNRRWSALDRFCLISCSDAHSPSKLGREACVFRSAVDYYELAEILRTKDRKRLVSTIEFFPEQGKYHWDGHRACKARLAPEESIRRGDVCPVCGKRVTIGVMHRVAALADRPAGYADAAGPAYTSVVPLADILAACLGTSAGSRTVTKEYDRLIDIFKTEFAILLTAPDETLWQHCPAIVAKAILNVRRGDIVVTPGYDGEYGTVDVLGDEK